jgi:hypothetical protein
MYCREDGTPYYIGKGKGNRINHHCHGVTRPCIERRKYLKTNLTEEQSIRHEIYLIHVLGRKDNGTGILRNRTNGGEGVSGCNQKKTQTHRENIRKGQLEQKTKLHQKWYLVENKSLQVSVKEFDTLRGICRKYNIDVGYICRILSGQRKSYKGWTIKKLSQTP